MPTTKAKASEACKKEPLVEFLKLFHEAIVYIQPKYALYNDECLYKTITTYIRKNIVFA